MNALHLRYCDQSLPDLPLERGVYALGRAQGQLRPVEPGNPWLLQLCCDRRGLWLTLAESVHGVHVNGRPVQQVAMLRAGDSIHVDGRELLLYATPNTSASLAPAQANDPITSLRWTLRGVGGPHHGRSLSLAQPLRIGSSPKADLCIDGNGITAEHALVEAGSDHALLRHAAADVLLNGLPVRQAVLRSGDQLVFGTQHRFVLEGPPVATVAPPLQALTSSDAGKPPSTPARNWTQRVPWLLLTALLLATALAALLAFGPR